MNSFKTHSSRRFSKTAAFNSGGDTLRDRLNRCPPTCGARVAGYRGSTWPRMLRGLPALSAIYGFLTQHIVTALTNFAFVATFVFGIRYNASFRTLLYENPEVIFIITVLVAGFGVGLTLYPKEHLLTSAVLRPWRRLEALVVAFTLAVPFTSIWLWNSKTHAVPMAALVVEFFLNLAILLFFGFITYEVWLTETNGGRGWRRTGMRLRRAGFPHFGQAIDDREIAKRESDPKWAQWVKRRDEREIRKLDLMEREIRP